MGSENVINIAGGGVVSSEAETAHDLMDLDIEVAGEGEITIVELLDALSSGREIEDIQGIVYKDNNGSLVKTVPKVTNRDLESLPWSGFNAIGMEEAMDWQKSLACFRLQGTNEPRSIPMMARPYQSIHGGK